MEEAYLEGLEIVDTLCKSSNEFNRFYQDAFQKSPFPIKLIPKSDLGGIKALAEIKIINEIKSYTIYYRDAPTADDALVYAHEILHLIRGKENKFLKIKNPTLKGGVCYGPYSWFS